MSYSRRVYDRRWQQFDEAVNTESSRTPSPVRYARNTDVYPSSTPPPRAYQARGARGYNNAGYRAPYRPARGVDSAISGYQSSYDRYSPPSGGYQNSRSAYNPNPRAARGRYDDYSNASNRDDRLNQAGARQAAHRYSPSPPDNARAARDRLAQRYAMAARQRAQDHSRQGMDNYHYSPPSPNPAYRNLRQSDSPARIELPRRGRAYSPENPAQAARGAAGYQRAQEYVPQSVQLPRVAINPNANARQGADGKHYVPSYIRQRLRQEEAYRDGYNARAAQRGEFPAPEPESGQAAPIKLTKEGGKKKAKTGYQNRYIPNPQTSPEGRRVVGYRSRQNAQIEQSSSDEQDDAYQPRFVPRGDYGLEDLPASKPKKKKKKEKGIWNGKAPVRQAKHEFRDRYMPAPSSQSDENLDGVYRPKFVPRTDDALATAKPKKKKKKEKGVWNGKAPVRQARHEYRDIYMPSSDYDEKAARQARKKARDEATKPRRFLLMPWQSNQATAPEPEKGPYQPRFVRRDGVDPFASPVLEASSSDEDFIPLPGRSTDAPRGYRVGRGKRPSRLVVEQSSEEDSLSDILGSQSSDEPSTPLVPIMPFISPFSADTSFEEEEEEYVFKRMKDKDSRDPQSTSLNIESDTDDELAALNFVLEEQRIAKEMKVKPRKKGFLARMNRRLMKMGVNLHLPVFNDLRDGELKDRQEFMVSLMESYGSDAVSEAHSAMNYPELISARERKAFVRKVIDIHHFNYAANHRQLLAFYTRLNTYIDNLNQMQGLLPEQQRQQLLTDFIEMKQEFDVFLDRSRKSSKPPPTNLIMGITAQMGKIVVRMKRALMDYVILPDFKPPSSALLPFGFADDLYDNTKAKLAKMKPMLRAVDPNLYASIASMLDEEKRCHDEAQARETESVFELIYLLAQSLGAWVNANQDNDKYLILSLFDFALSMKPDEASCYKRINIGLNTNAGGYQLAAFLSKLNQALAQVPSFRHVFLDRCKQTRIALVDVNNNVLFETNPEHARNNFLKVVNMVQKQVRLSLDKVELVAMLKAYSARYQAIIDEAEQPLSAIRHPRRMLRRTYHQLARGRHIINGVYRGRMYSNLVAQTQSQAELDLIIMGMLDNPKLKKMHKELKEIKHRRGISTQGMLLDVRRYQVQARLEALRVYRAYDHLDEIEKEDDAAVKNATNAFEREFPPFQ